MTYTIAMCTVRKKNPNDGQRNCPKHVEIYSKNKFEKLVRLVGFIIRIYHDAWSPERQILQTNVNLQLLEEQVLGKKNVSTLLRTHQLINLFFPLEMRPNAGHGLLDH